MNTSLMDEITEKTVELETQYNNHIKRLDSEFAGFVSDLKLELKTSLEELAKKESEKMSFSKFFKTDKKNDKKEEKPKIENPIEAKELTDEEKLAEIEKRREEEKSNKKPAKPIVEKVEEPKPLSRKEQALHDKYKADLKALIEKFNFKCGDLHDLFVTKIIDLEKKYGIKMIREVPKKPKVEK